MFARPLKIGYFILEGLNSFGTVLYFYYFYFYMQQAFGFGNKANLVLAALNGLVYALVCWPAGRFAEKVGYFAALRVGFAVMLGAVLVGSQLGSAIGQVLVMLTAVAGMCFTWPTLEALVSGGERRAGVQHMVGIYNVVWAATAALAYFIGGAILDSLGLRSLFYVPAAVFFLQLCLAVWLEKQARRLTTTLRTPAEELSPEVEVHPHPPAEVTRFLRMSWLANPFAYIAINTLIAVIPGIATRLGLSTMLAGFCCSVWCFARLGAFVLLWWWTAWHYRFRWLLLSYAGLVASFAVVLIAPNVAVLVLAQLAFGGAIGLIYSSSLFYSMDASQTKGEHGGIHESVIGIGNFAGPAVGAASLHFLPQHTHNGVIAVTVLLLCGLAGLGAIWKKGQG